MSSLDAATKHLCIQCPRRGSDLLDVGRHLLHLCLQLAHQRHDAVDALQVLLHRHEIHAGRNFLESDEGPTSS